MVFLLLLSVSYGVLLIFRREPETDEFSETDKEDTAVYNIAFLICIFTLSSACSCTLLLPASVASNEILLMYPDSYYLQWVNGSLVTSKIFLNFNGSCFILYDFDISELWDLTFYLSRALIFVLIPFIYLFTEAIGFIGMRQGIMARVYESVAVMAMAAFVLFGTVFLGLALIYPLSDLALIDVCRFLDRFATSLGFVLLLISTPIGYAAAFQLAARRSLPVLQRKSTGSFSLTAESKPSIGHMPPSERTEVLMLQKEYVLRQRKSHTNGNVSLEDSRLETINNELNAIEQQEKQGFFQSTGKIFSRNSTLVRHLSPPIMACLTFCLAALSSLSTLFTVFERALTSRTLVNYDEELRLGHESLSRLGIFGSTLGLILQLCCAVAAISGLYHLPLLNLIQPKRGESTMTRLILNCAIWIILAQAFPSFSSCLGLTSFQLLSGFRNSSDWLLSSAYIVFIIDVIYIASVMFHFVNALTAPLVSDFVQFIINKWDKFRARHEPIEEPIPVAPQQNETYDSLDLSLGSEVEIIDDTPENS